MNTFPLRGKVGALFAYALGRRGQQGMYRMLVSRSSVHARARARTRGIGRMAKLVGGSRGPCTREVARRCTILVRKPLLIRTSFPILFPLDFGSSHGPPTRVLGIARSRGTRRQRVTVTVPSNGFRHPASTSN